VLVEVQAVLAAPRIADWISRPTTLNAMNRMNSRRAASLARSRYVQCRFIP